ncbi:MAG: HEAT repeat domain-containing protein [Rubrivivax sp.]|nr:HEAT repeat domain-containing protein [Rubrivivax sp.]
MGNIESGDFRQIRRLKGAGLSGHGLDIKEPDGRENGSCTLGDEKPEVRAAAIDAIGQRGDAALLKAVVPRLEDGNETVRFNAAACIIRLSK